MPIVAFPDPESTGPEGLVAIGGDLHSVSLIHAYRSGIFPWPMPEYPVVWFCPDPRAILRFEDLHVPKSLRAALRKNPFTYTLNAAFTQVIQNCAKTPRPEQAGTWITSELEEAYLEMHRLGHAHSVEVWLGEDKERSLVGGIYGLAVDGVFSAESMFYRRPNASKAALLHLIERLKERGIAWMDIQMMTPHLKTLGAEELPRRKFLDLLRQSQKLGDKIF